MFEKFTFYYYSLMNVIDHDFNSRPRCYKCPICYNIYKEKQIIFHNINAVDHCYQCNTAIWYTKDDLWFAIYENKIISKQEFITLVNKLKKIKAFQ